MDTPSQIGAAAEREVAYALERAGSANQTAGVRLAADYEIEPLD